MADIQLAKALAIVERLLRMHRLTLIEDLRQGLQEGASFSQLLRDRPAHFPKFYTNLVEVGEKSGQLAQVMDQARTYLKEKVSSKALLYFFYLPFNHLGVSV